METSNSCPCGGGCLRVAVACLNCTKTARVPFADATRFEDAHQRHVVITWHPEAQQLG